MRGTEQPAQVLAEPGRRISKLNRTQVMVLSFSAAAWSRSWRSWRSRPTSSAGP
jgi:hypothetical protein